MKWMRLKEQECQIIQTFQKIETFMVSLVGSQISTSSAQRITMSDTPLIENSSTAQWTITLHSITQQWQTLNFSDKTHQQNLLPEKRSRPWAFRTDQNTAQQWDLLKAHFKLPYTLLHSCSIEMCPTSIKLMIKYKRQLNILTPFHSWERLQSSGTK